MDLEIRQITGLNARVSFDGGDWDVAFSDPFTPEREQELRWYFEKHLEFPMLETHRAGAAAASVEEYGNRLFQQLFTDHDLHAAFAKQHEAGEVRIIVIGSPDFHRIHWEALWKPGAPKPLAHRVVITRKVPSKGFAKITLQVLPVIRVLVVVARPGGIKDVGYRTISRPLVETLHQANLAVEVEFVRPGTWERLQEKLTERKPGYYHALHFDGHGVGAGQGYLFFESTGKQGEHAIKAAEFADVVNDARIPVVILNACQSAMQEGESESNLASRLSAAGVRGVLGMAYSVTVSAAKEFMEAFYREAFGHGRLSEAVTRGRQRLNAGKRRNAHFGMQIELEDWMLPVLYENEPVKLEVRATFAEESAFFESQSRLYQARRIKYAFWGRDLDILSIERCLLTAPDKNILLLEGMGGAGKTTLLQHLAWWWQVTGLVGRVFVFEYDQKPWTRQQILHEIADKLGMHMPAGELIQQEKVAKELRARRCLLVLDNLESVTGEHLAIGQSLPEGERQNLREFLSKLRGGQTLVLMGSRSDEAWLAPDTFGDNVHALRGLDPEARTSFAEEILRSVGADPKELRASREYRELLDLLAGHPLAMQVVLANLKAKTPAEVLKALREGDVALDQGGNRTESILKCIDYSHTNLSAEARHLLQCLAPFTRVVFLPALGKYVELLQQQSELADLPWWHLDRVLAEADRWGLAKAEGPFLHLQPVFPFFLRSRAADASRKAAVETAFRKHYQDLCAAVSQGLQSKDPQKRQVGRMMARLEYENASRALDLSLAAQDSILQPYRVLSGYLDETKDNTTGLALAEKVIAGLEKYPKEALEGQIGLEMVGAVDGAAKRFLLLKRYTEAKAAYEQAIEILRANRGGGSQSVLRLIYHQLGVVAQQQRQWAEAGWNYREALRIGEEFNDRYGQARTYHQLGMVAEEQQQWAEAEGNYREALRIKEEFNDRYSQAHTYHNLGRVAQNQRQWAKAEQNYCGALQIYEEFNDRYEQADTYHNLGIVAQEQGRWAEAEQNYREALRIKVEFNDCYSQASTYYQLGVLAQEQRQWAEAENNGIEALRIFQEYNDEHSLGIALGLLARLSVECPDLTGQMAEILGVSTAQIEDLFRSRTSQADSAVPAE